ncbi:Mur ligase domain-containing protein [Kitasatospora cineracea]|uniref:UDP-N-acetylmuramate--alanine ligase n=1 Tax=Kitasatospora cineracea TaxID=88074 RepID=A0A8G1XFI7_9ACTN|nr:Mur ligase domain-containing protein [Kitasatospora cineracea]ROR46491.1 UDP-N-acetylmuramate--alanine ligase [Kitasatospora cineracea]
MSITAPSGTAPLPGLLSAVHLVGSCEPGMEGLARWLAGAGADVTGSVPEAEQGAPAVAALAEAGIRVRVGFDAEHLLADRTAVLWSGASGPHPELDRAQALRLPILSRDIALRAVCAEAGSGAVAVAGSHSTATAAAALAHLLDDGATGWILNTPARGATAGHAAGQRVVVDLCPDTATHEAAPRGGWQRRPTPYVRLATEQLAAALIMATGANVPHYEDHVAGLDAAERLARRTDILVLPTWDNSTVNLRERLADRPVPGQHVVTVGIAPDSTARIVHLTRTGVGYRTVLRYRQEEHSFLLPVTGEHHARAVCAAVACALALGEHPQTVVARAAGFRGVEGCLATAATQRGVTVAMSRARHPHEVAQDVQAARLLTEGALIAVLEPDGIARAGAHAAELGDALVGADQVLLLPVNTPLAGHAGPDPLEAIEEMARQRRGDGTVHRTGRSPEQQIDGLVGEGDLVLVIGTGAARLLGPRLLARLGHPTPPTAPAPGLDQETAAVANSLSDLTPKSIELAVAIAAGRTARDIARGSSTYRSTEGARKAVEHLLRKTGARHRRQLTAWATAAKIVTAPSRDTKALTSPPVLPPRIQTILQGWADGRSTEEIRKELNVSQPILDVYIRTLQLHLDVDTLEQAMVVAVLSGLVRVELPGDPYPAEVTP